MWHWWKKYNLSSTFVFQIKKYFIKSLKIIRVALQLRDETNYNQEQNTLLLGIIIYKVLKKVFGYVTLIQENKWWEYKLSHPMKHYLFIYEENYLDGETFVLKWGSLRIQTSNSNSQPAKLNWQLVFRNASERFLVSLKCIIHILTCFVTQAYVFYPLGVTLVKITS